MTTHHRVLGVALALAGVGCQDPPGDGGVPAGPPLLEFQGAYDAESARLHLSATSSARGLTRVLPVARDGVPGTGPAGTVELVTTQVRADLPGCGFASSICGDVDLRTFFGDTPVFDAIAQITSITPVVGHEGLNSDRLGTKYDATFGLWYYGNLDPDGRGDEQVRTRTWTFGRGAGGSFTFKGVVYGDVDACQTACLGALDAAVASCEASFVVEACDAQPTQPQRDACATTTRTSQDGCVGTANTNFGACRAAC